MSNFAEYRDAYDCMKMERQDGILEVRFHADDGPWIWHRERGFPFQITRAFADIAEDNDNKVVIMTGSGDIWSQLGQSSSSFRPTPNDWDAVMRNGVSMINNLVNINALVISCINGPATCHAEIPLLADIVLACPEAAFQDRSHFMSGVTPGDGIALIFPLLLGFNRARYFHIMGQTIGAEEALSLGLVNELMPREKLLPRARGIAQHLAQENPLVIRYTRLLFMQTIRRLTTDLLPFGLALEGLGFVHDTLNG